MNAVQRYICGRLASALPVLFGVSLLAFGLGQLSPGDPAEIMLEGTGMGMPSAEEVAALRSYLGLDQPWYAQYGLWLRRLLHGDGGMSYHLGMPVFTALQKRVSSTESSPNVGRRAWRSDRMLPMMKAAPASSACHHWRAWARCACRGSGSSRRSASRYRQRSSSR